MAGRMRVVYMTPEFCVNADSFLTDLNTNVGKCAMAVTMNTLILCIITYKHPCSVRDAQIVCQCGFVLDRS